VAHSLRSFARSVKSDRFQGSGCRVRGSVQVPGSVPGCTVRFSERSAVRGGSAGEGADVRTLNSGLRTREPGTEPGTPEPNPEPGTRNPGTDPTK